MRHLLCVSAIDSAAPASLDARRSSRTPVHRNVRLAGRLVARRGRLQPLGEGHLHRLGLPLGLGPLCPPLLLGLGLLGGLVVLAAAPAAPARLDARRRPLRRGLERLSEYHQAIHLAQAVGGAGVFLSDTRARGTAAHTHPRVTHWRWGDGVMGR